MRFPASVGMPPSSYISICFRHMLRKALAPLGLNRRGAQMISKAPKGVGAHGGISGVGLALKVALTSFSRPPATQGRPWTRELQFRVQIQRPPLPAGRPSKLQCLLYATATERMPHLHALPTRQRVGSVCTRPTCVLVLASGGCIFHGAGKSGALREASF